MAFPKENNSCFIKSNELHGSIDHCNHANFSQIIPNSYNNLSLNQQEKSEILLDPTLDYISRYLLEEEIDEKINGYQEAALRDMEKPFYDILGEKYPPPQDNQLVSKQSKVNPDFTTSDLKDQVGPNFSESLEQHPGIDNLLTIEFQRGVEEGLKFLPNHNRLSINLQVSNLTLNTMKKCDRNSLEIKSGKAKESDVLNKSKGKKNTNDAGLDLLEGRNCKIPMVSSEEIIRDEMFDKVLLYHRESCPREEISNLREIKELEAKSYSKNQNQHDHTNLTTRLISCAEAISMNDNKIARELIKQIKKEASPIGDGVQRLACILVDGLEARLSGSGYAAYRQYVTRQVHTIDYLKVYQMMSTRVSPTVRVSFHFANESILSATCNASKIHVVDFGITFGFQWPSLIQSLAKRKGGPPKLRITGVDLPQPGFHPAEKIDKTGRRLEDYARSFGVPFEYQGIASQWESISIDDLSINDDEVLIINSIFRFCKVMDGPLLDRNNSRNKLLGLIQEAKPKVLIQGIYNISFSPFFITRFRKVLLHFSKFFDMLDASVARNCKHRQILERDLLGPSIFNLIACEGSDLVVRPETYKQWHMQNLQAGFEQLPIDPSVVKECNGMVRNSYNGAFFTEEDCNWFFVGYKGNLLYAISLWKPKIE